MMGFLAADERQLQQLDEIGCLALLQALTDCH